MPIAGAGSRFAQSPSGSLPKPLVPVAGRPLIDWATRNLAGVDGGEWLFIVRQEHSRAEPRLAQRLQATGPKVAIHELPEATPSPVHTLNAARPLWRDASSLLITNCDQFLSVSITPWMEAFEQGTADIGVLTVNSTEPHFVHLVVDEANAVTRVAGRVSEPLPAAAGYYFFRSGNLLANLIDRCLSETNRGRELCVTDLISEALALHLTVCAWGLGEVGEKYFPLGDPVHVARYESQLSKL